jgi:hypothetical protein
MSSYDLKVKVRDIIAPTMFWCSLLASLPLGSLGGESCHTGAASHATVPSSMSYSLLQVSKPENTSSNTQLALRESLGFIDEADSLWLKRKEVHVGAMRLEAAHLDDGIGSAQSWFQTHWEPSFHCDLEERIGNVGDGGKWVCNPSSMSQAFHAGASCLVYSFGSNGQFDFEEGVRNRISSSCEIHVFDPSPPGTVAEKYKASRSASGKHVHYHQWPLGLDGKMVMGVPAKSLATIVSELGHSGRRIDILKMDCEGCEWESYDGWLSAKVDIRQILIELHWGKLPGTESDKSKKAHQLFKTLSKSGYAVFNKEANLLAQGTCVEYAFVRLSPEFSNYSVTA